MADSLSSLAERMNALFAVLTTEYGTQRARVATPEEAATLEGQWARVRDASERSRTAWSTAGERPEDPATREQALSALVDFVVAFGAVTAEESGALATRGSGLRAEFEGLKLDLARLQHVTVPRVVADAMTLVRAGSLAPGERPVLARAKGEIFTAVLYDARYWNLKPARGQTLTLPFEPGTSLTEQNTATLTRKVLTPGVLRAWLATWMLAANRNAEYGLFTWDLREVLLELYQAPPVYTTVRGKRYARPSPTLERDIRDHFSTLHTIYLHGLGNIKPEPPQQLIATYRDTNDKDRVVYQHAPLAWIAVRKSFTQVPLAVLRLDASDVPLALGIANVWRAHATTTLRGEGHYRTTLRDLATEAGEDHRAGARNDGRTYWSRLQERLARAIYSGNLGSLHVQGEGPDALATLTPSDALATVYQPLIDAADRQQEFAEEARFDAAVRSLLEAPRRRGRPRKAP